NPPGVSDQVRRTTLDGLKQLNELNYQHVGDPETHTRIQQYELAYRMQSSVPELTDFSKETAATFDLYGEAAKQPGTFANTALLARRMVERGVRFINIIHASWDHHANLDNELAYNAGMADQPVAALIRDLKQRGLLDSTMVVWGAEFGRTPLGENRGGNNNNVSGRDHHPHAFSMFLAGGGIKGGQVYGASDEFGWRVVENEVPVNDLHATMLHSFGFDHLNLTHRFQGRDFRLTDVAGNVIPQLLKSPPKQA
ncbi:MAG: DUF1501 domain-containing protein, partial [Planctomycetaceae bacterium]|nr:DUF1501 domain-containing protein [Planctomycetaceae bacterium]